MVGGFVAVLFFIFLFLISTSPAMAPSPFPGVDWNWVPHLHLLNPEQFKDVAYPLVQISANAYRYPDSSVPIPGWIPSSKIAPRSPIQGGVHAILYEEEAAKNGPPRLILAFRGTQTSDSLDSLADMCADAILWQNTAFSDLPQECDVFDESTLDYYSQALNYTNRVIDTYSEVPLLLTGHSLGAGLAILVSASLSERCILPVIGFAPPGTRLPMARRSLHLKALEGHKVFSIAHQWDEVLRTQWDGQVGVLCLYQKPLSPACATCFANGSMETTIVGDHELSQSRSLPKVVLSGFTSDILFRIERLQGTFMPTRTDCLHCFFETHYLKQLIEVVEQGNQPVCEQKKLISWE